MHNHNSGRSARDNGTPASRRRLPKPLVSQHHPLCPTRSTCSQTPRTTATNVSSIACKFLRRSSRPTLPRFGSELGRGDARRQVERAKTGILLESVLENPKAADAASSDRMPRWSSVPGQKLVNRQTACLLASDAIAPEFNATWDLVYFPCSGLLKRNVLLRFAVYQARQ